MVGDGDSTAGTWGLTDGDILVEGGGTLDGWLVDLLVEPDVVDGSVRGDGSLVGASGLVTSWVLHHVVLDEGVLAPSVDGKKTDTGGRKGTRVGDWAKLVSLGVYGSRWADVRGATGRPSESNDKVGLGVVVDTEAASGKVWSVGDSSAARDVVLVVVDWSRSALEINWLGGWSGESGCDQRAQGCDGEQHVDEIELS